MQKMNNCPETLVWEKGEENQARKCSMGQQETGV